MAFFSNFPRRKERAAVFWPDDPTIDMEVLEKVCAVASLNLMLILLFS
jgi:hypothetical protein